MKKSKELTTGEVLEVIKGFAHQSEDNVAFGVIGNHKTGDVSTFMKGENICVVAMLCANMAKYEDFKEVIFTATKVFKLFPINKILQEE